MRFNWGVFDQHLKSYVPLHLMGAAGFAVDLELYLAPPVECMEITNELTGFLFLKLMV